MATKFDPSTGTFVDDGMNDEAPAPADVLAPPDPAPALPALDVDKIAAQVANVGRPPAPPPTTIPAAALAPTVKPSPAATPAPAAAPAAPSPAPAAAPATRVQKTVMTPEGQAAIDQLDTATKTESDATRAAGEAAAGRRDVEAEGLRQRAQMDLERQQRIQATLARAQADYDRRVKEYDKQYDALKGMKETDFYADKSTGYKIGAAIGLALGAISQAFGGRNVAADMIGKEIEAHAARQRNAIVGQRELVEKAHVGLEGAQAERDRQITLWEAAAYDRAAHDVQARAAAFGGPEERAKAAAAAAALQAKAAEKKALLLKMTGEQVVTDTGRQTETERLALAKAKAAKARLSGGAAGGVGGGHADALREILKGQSPADVQAKYKLSDKALKGLVQTAGSVAAAKRGNARLDLAEDKKLTTDIDKWAQQHEIKQVEHTQHDINGILKVLTDVPHNPHAQASAFEKSVSAARGGAATRSALDLAIKHMGGGLDSVEAIISKMDSGEFGPAQLANLKGAMKAQLAAQQAHGKELYDAFEEYRKTLPPEQQAQAERERTRLFSGFQGFGGKAHGPANYVEAAKAAKERLSGGAPAPVAAPPLPPGAVPAIKNGRRGIILNGAFHAAQ